MPHYCEFLRECQAPEIFIEELRLNELNQIIFSPLVDEELYLDELVDWRMGKQEWVLFHKEFKRVLFVPFYYLVEEEGEAAIYWIIFVRNVWD